MDQGEGLLSIIPSTECPHLQKRLKVKEKETLTSDVLVTFIYRNVCMYVCLFVVFFLIFGFSFLQKLIIRDIFEAGVC